MFKPDATFDDCLIGPHDDEYDHRVVGVAARVLTHLDAAPVIYRSQFAAVFWERLGVYLSPEDSEVLFETALFTRKNSLSLSSAVDVADAINNRYEDESVADIHLISRISILLTGLRTFVGAMLRSRQHWSVPCSRTPAREPPPTSACTVSKRQAFNYSMRLGTELTRLP